ncbi:MAG TPA: HAD family hydrolase [bacterium]|nr:HAD family hydrolase [bacterium]HOL35201.1 HAD family hydrolase [bacterium]HPP08598.1 HAD family hydrolase [bacterium]
MKPVFLDRDGVISIFTPNDYLKTWSEFQFLPDAISGLQKLSGAGFNIVIVSNQAGVSKGIFSEHDLNDITEKMLAKLKKHSINILKVYYCIHKTEDNCNCRKPKTGMIEKFISEYGDFERSESFFVGDSDIDIELGSKAGMKTILVLSGKTKSAEETESWNYRPDFIVKNLKEAADIIINHSKGENHGKENQGSGLE